MELSNGVVEKWRGGVMEWIVYLKTSLNPV